MKTKILLLSLSAWFLITSCQKSGIAEFSTLPVVESYLAPGKKITMTISEKIPYYENAVMTDTSINTLDIRVGYNGAYYNMIPLGNGIYSDTAGNISVIADSTYTLLFIFNGSNVYSSTIIPSKPIDVTQSATTIKMSQIDPENQSWINLPDPVEITFSNDDESYYLATVECIDSIRVPVFKDSIPENDIFSSMPVTGTQINIMPMRLSYFGLNRIILYHINPEYATFFTQQASTSQNYQEPPTNIENGLGIFTGINADTLFLNVIQIQ